VSISPNDGNSSVAPSSTITLRFSENVKAGYGLIALTTAGGAVIETFSVSSSSRLSFDGGTQLTIRPSQALPYGTELVLSVPAGAVVDMAGNGYAGLSGYDFVTVAAPDRRHARTGQHRRVAVRGSAAAVQRDDRARQRHHHAAHLCGR
jgi:hypothetical protein